jgi:hypothetical protein
MPNPTAPPFSGDDLTAEQFLRREIPPSMKGPVWDAFIAALGVGEQLAWDNAPSVARQMFLATAAGIWLDRRAAGLGLQRPNDVGMPDEAFRQYAIQIASQQQTIPAILEALKVFYGIEAVQAGIAAGVETYVLADGYSLTLTFDNVQAITVTFKAADFANIATATAQEVVGVLNREFYRSGVNALAIVSADPTTGKNLFTIYTGTLGGRGSIQAAAGAAQVALGLPTTLDRLLSQQRSAYVLTRGKGAIEVVFPATANVVSRNSSSAAYIVDPQLEIASGTCNVAGAVRLVTSAPHNLHVGNQILIEGLSFAVGGGLPISLNGLFTVAQVIDAYTIGYQLEVPPAPTPGPVIGLNVTAGDTVADLSWSAPANAAVSGVSSYHIVVSPGGTIVNQSGTSLHLTSLTDGTLYTFTVNAVGASFSGAPSSVTGTPYATPGAVIGLASTPGDTVVDLSWSPPANAAASGVSSYRITLSPPDAGPFTQAGTTLHVTGLTNGTPYTFNVHAIGAIANGPDSPTTATPFSASPPIGLNLWNGVARKSDGSILVAVGSDSSLATTKEVRSTDGGVTWSAGTFNIGGLLNRVTYGLVSGIPKFVAVGVQSDFSSGIVALSADGSTWTQGTMLAGNWLEVICAGGQLVAVGSNFTHTQGKLAYSGDGLSWSAGTIAATVNRVWKSVAYSGTVYVAVGVGSGPSRGIVATSADGHSWTEGTMPSGLWKKVLWDATHSRFVAVGLDLGISSGKCATSPDGITWTSRTIVDGDWRDLYFDGTALVAAGSLLDFNTGAGAVSYDGGVTWQYTPIPSSTGNIWNGVTLDGVRFVAVGNDAGQTVGRSSIFDLVPDNFWSHFEMPATNGSLPSGRWASVTWASWLNLYVAVGSDGSTNGLAATSPDGRTWTARTIPAGNWTQVANNGTSLLVATGYDFSTGVSKSVTSSDGVTWSSTHTIDVTEADHFYPPHLAFGNGKFVVGNRQKLISSSDGVTWTVRFTSSSFSLLPSNVVWSPTQSSFYAIALLSSGVNDLYTSPDGVTWTTHSSGFNMFLFEPPNLSLASSGSNLLVFKGSASPSFAVTSPPTGTTWTSGSVFDPVGSGQVISVYWDALDSKYIATTQSSFASTVTSPDGTGAWTSVSSENEQFCSFATNGTSLVAVGGYLNSSVPVAGVRPVPAGLPFEVRSLVVAPDSGALDVSWSPPVNASTAGVTNYHISLTPADAGPFTQAGTSVHITGLNNGTEYKVTVYAIGTAGNGPIKVGSNTPRVLDLFGVAADGSGHFIAAGDSIIKTSSNGTTWTKRSAPLGFFVDVKFGNGIAMAVGDNVITSSDNGTTWSSVGYPGFFINSISCKGTRWVAVGFGQIATSDDNGVSWTARTPTDANHNYICIDNDGTNFIIGGSDGNTDNGILVRSTDSGVTWTVVNSDATVTEWSGVKWIPFLSLWDAVGNDKTFSGGPTGAKTSTNGTAWTSRTLTGFCPFALAASGTVVAVVGTDADQTSPGTISASSTNATSYTARTIPSGAYFMVAYDTSLALFAAVGQQMTISTSPNAITWTAR